MAQKARKGAIAPVLRVEEIRVRSVDSKLHRLPDSPVLALRTKDPEMVYGIRGNQCVYEITYDHKAIGRSNQVIWTAVVKLAAVCSSPAVIDEGVIQANHATVHKHFYNYQREYLNSLTFQMGLPPLLIELFSPGR